MATYYVATTGNNSNSGTTGAPWLTLTYALNTHGLSAGDILNIRPGTYQEHLHGMTLTGTTGAHITIQAQTTGTVTIQAPVDGRCITIDRNDQTYVDWLGINYDATLTQYECIKTEAFDNDPHDMSWQNFTATGGHVAGTLQQQQTILFSNPGSTITSPTGRFTLRNGIVIAGGENDACHGTYISSNNCVVDNVTYSNIAGAGVQVYNGYGHSLTSTVIKNCVIHDFRSPIFGEPGDLAGRHWGIVVYEANCTIFNNVIYGVKSGSSGGSCSGIEISGDSNKVYNNTIYNCTNPCIGIRIVSGSGNGVYNNICWSVYNNYSDSGSGTLGGGSVPSTGTNLFGVDPSFVDAANANFRLANGSAAVDVGTTLADVPTDITGVTRPQGSKYDVGAYEQFNLVGSLVSIVSAALGQNGGTTTGANTSGLTGLFVHIAWYSGAGGGGLNPSISDSKSNTWIAKTVHTNPGVRQSGRWFYCLNPTTDAAQTFTCSITNGYVSICVLGITGTWTYDQETGSGGSDDTQTISPGSVTPSQAISTILQGLGLDGLGAAQTGVAIDTSFIILQSVPYNVGVNEANFVAAKNLSSASAQNPTWTWTGVSEAAASTLVFVQGSAATTSAHRLLLLSVGG